jgi:hypothetical protein
MQLPLEITILYLQCVSVPDHSIQGRIAVLWVCDHPTLFMWIMARQVPIAIRTHGLIA